MIHHLKYALQILILYPFHSVIVYAFFEMLIAQPYRLLRQDK